MELEKSVPRWSGMAVLAAGILFALLTFGDLLTLPEEFFFILALPMAFFLLIGLPGIRARQEGRETAIGKVGYVVMAASLAVLTILFGVASYVTAILKEDVETFLPDWLESFLAIGFFGTLIGALLFGIGLVIARGFGPLPSWLFLIALPLGLLIDVATGAFFQENGDTPAYGFYVGVPLFGIALIWMGVKLLSGHGTPDSEGAEKAAD